MARLALDRENVTLEAQKLEFEKQKQQLEILKFFHTAGLDRWKDRRKNEWKLNYAIWAAIAGLDAILLHDKSAFVVPQWLIAAGIVICIVLHLAYLWPTIVRAISEMELQSDTEHAVRQLITDPTMRNRVKENHLGGAIDRFETRPRVAWMWKRYGLLAPIGLTIALLLLAGLLLRGYGRQ